MKILVLSNVICHKLVFQVFLIKHTMMANEEKEEAGCVDVIEGNFGTGGDRHL